MDLVTQALEENYTWMITYLPKEKEAHWLQMGLEDQV